MPEPLSFWDLCAHLVKDGWGALNGLTMDKIADMTDPQLIKIYLKAVGGDEQEERKRAQSTPVGSDAMGYQALYMMIWMKRGLTYEEVKQKWEQEWPDLRRENTNMQPWNDNIRVKVPVKDAPKKEEGDS